MALDESQPQDKAGLPAYSALSRCNTWGALSYKAKAALDRMNAPGRERGSYNPSFLKELDLAQHTDTDPVQTHSYLALRTPDF